MCRAVPKDIGAFQNLTQKENSFMPGEVNFTLAGSDEKRRAPSYFASACLFTIAAVGLTLIPPLVGLVSSLVGERFPGLDGAFFDNLVQVLFYGVCVVLPVGLYMRARPGIADAMRVNGIGLKKAALCAFAGVVGLFFTNYVSYLWLILIESLGGTLSSGRVAVPTTASALSEAIVFSAVLPGVCEEVLFRGALLSAWERRGSRAAVVVSALWFTMLHASVEGAPAEFVNGVVLAVIVVLTDSIFAGMIYHTVYNSAALIVSYIASFQPETAAEAASLFAAIGGAAGLISVLFNILISGLTLFFFIRVLGRIRLLEGKTGFGVPKIPKQRDWSWAELGVTLAGAAVMSIWYAADIFRIAGYIP